MNLSDDELRAMVRGAIERHAAADRPALVPHQEPVRLHESQRLFPVVSGGETDGACLIEPAVLCNHCGYCQSYGH